VSGLFDVVFFVYKIWVIFKVFFKVVGAMKLCYISWGYKKVMMKGLLNLLNAFKENVNILISYIEQFMHYILTGPVLV
jgi:hypothetical protein